MEQIVKNIRVKLIDKDDQPTDAAKEVRSKNEFYTDDTETMAYYHSSDLLYRVYNYNGGDTMYDKKFSRDRRMVNTSYNWKINLLFHNEDLMDSLNNSVTALRDKDERNVNNVTMMSSIINLLRVRGITKVIIIDLSCSVIRNGKSVVTPRTERHQLFDHLKKGGITKKRYKTMKCRKYNKRIRYRKKTKKISSCGLSKMLRD